MFTSWTETQGLTMRKYRAARTGLLMQITQQISNSSLLTHWLPLTETRKIKTPPLAQCKEAGLCKSTALGGLLMMQCVPHDILRADPQLLWYREWNANEFCQSYLIGSSSQGRTVLGLCSKNLLKIVPHMVNLWNSQDAYVWEHLTLTFIDAFPWFLIRINPHRRAFWKGRGLK